ncbi:MAG TPA: signal peptidase I [Ruminococcaceae bacterium]|jgi:signal peptidase I|nr:signal peptidase I [Oscillospiraceae bacterium]HCC02825.1 signal peptidase I [Oscillospiraceae bacterium]HCM24019.1 signal peptidase I [Oscillospiraceae bacterium]
MLDSEKTGAVTSTENQEVPQQKKKVNSSYKNPFWSWVLPIAVAVIVALLFCAFIARPSRVMGDSMQNTCHDGDLVILWELNYHPQRGDVVVVNDQNLLQENLIKRVIAVGGDHLVISSGTVILNGKKLTENYIKERVWSGPNVNMIIPADKVFLMGDNRNHSTDSRVIGPVNVSSIIGRVSLRLFPFADIRTF